MTIQLPLNYQIITVAGEHFNHDSLSLRFSFVDFEFNFEDGIPIEDVNIDNMLNGIKQLHLFLDNITTNKINMDCYN